MKGTRLPCNGEATDKSLSCAGHSTQRKIKYRLERTSGGLWSNLLQDYYKHWIKRFEFWRPPRTETPAHSHFSSELVQPHTSLPAQKDGVKVPDQQNQPPKQMV